MLFWKSNVEHKLDHIINLLIELESRQESNDREIYTEILKLKKKK